MRLQFLLHSLFPLRAGNGTTYRKMGEDTIDMAVRIAGLPKRPSRTKALHIHGWSKASPSQSEWQFYGADMPLVAKLAGDNATLTKKLHDDLPCRPVDVLWAVRHEMARSVEDVLSRRSRCLLLDARASVEMAPRVAAIMAKEMGKDSVWEKRQVEAYQQLAKRYLVS